MMSDASAKPLDCRARRAGRPFGWVLVATALVLAGSPIIRARDTLPQGNYGIQPLEKLERLVAPIALYPDSLVAEVLAASTHPREVVKTLQWLRTHTQISRSGKANLIDKGPWDASIKALIAFPSVLGNMSENFSWTMRLGEAYANQPQDVMAAVQALRHRARAAGRLVSTPEQVVTQNGPDIVIEPASPNFVYIPEYDPWLAYGAAIEAWPGWYKYPGIWLNSRNVSFVKGFSVAFIGAYPWGWSHWGCNWSERYVTYDNDRYVAHPSSGAPQKGNRGGTQTGDTTASYPLAPHVRGGAGLPLAPRYRLHGAGGTGQGYRLNSPNPHSKGFRLGPKYRLGHSGPGYPLHHVSGFPLGPSARSRVSLLPPKKGPAERPVPPQSAVTPNHASASNGTSSRVER